MTAALRGVRHDSDALINQVDIRLARLRAGQGTDAPPTDLATAELVADRLRRLIAETAQASAADRARVRAAVHYFLGRGRDRRLRSIAENVRVVNEIIGDLGQATLSAVDEKTPTWT